MKRIINVVASLIIITVTLVVYKKISVKEEKPKVKLVTQGIPVKTLVVRKTSELLEMELWGEVKYRRDISMKSEIEGRVLKTSPKLRPGYTVKAGEVLVEIDNERLIQQRIELEANLLATKALTAQLLIEEQNLKAEIELASVSVKLAEEDVERHEKLVKNSNASKLTLSNFKQSLTRAKSTRQQLESKLKVIPQRKASNNASVKSIEASIALISRDIKDSVIKAPFDARITGEVVSAGDYIRKGDLICDLVDPEWFEIWINIGLKEMVALGQVKGLELYGVNYSKFRFLNELDKNIQADFLIFEVKGSRLKARELVKVKVKGQKLSDVVILPESALRNDRQSVYLNIDSKLAIKTVKPILADQGSVYISEGLSKGDQVVVTRLNELPEGTLIDASREK